MSPVTLNGVLWPPPICCAFCFIFFFSSPFYTFLPSFCWLPVFLPISHVWSTGMATLVGDTLLVSIIKVGVTNYSPRAKPARLLDPAAVPMHCPWPPSLCGTGHCWEVASAPATPTVRPFSRESLLTSDLNHSRYLLAAEWIGVWKTSQSGFT